MINRTDECIKSPYSSKKIGVFIFILLTSLIAIVVMSLALGSVHIGINQIWKNLIGQPTPDEVQTIIWHIRFPRVLVAIMTGALFAISGTILQNITRNPLADPSLVGVSQGASLAVVATLIMWPEIGNTYRSLFALGGAVATAGLIQMIALRSKQVSGLRFILTGVGIATFISALIATMLTYGQINQAQSALNWLSGSVYTANWHSVKFLTMMIIVSAPILFVFSKPMSVLRMGDEVATGLGVATQKNTLVLIGLSVMLVACAVTAVGPMAFVGLIAPHLTRRLFSTSTEIHLLLSALVGGIMVSIADLVGRTVVAPFQIPAGLVTVLIGVPSFVFLMLSDKRRSN